jgi:hypothetical protein
VQYDQPGLQDVAWTRADGWTRLSLVTVSGEPGIETGKLWYLGRGDGTGQTGIPFADVPFYQSFAPKCGRHDAILDSRAYFYESVAALGSPGAYTLRAAVEDFVSGERAVPSQLQDNWDFPRPSGVACEL